MENSNPPFKEGGLYHGIRMGGEYVFLETLKSQASQYAKLAYNQMSSQLSSSGEALKNSKFTAALNILKSFADYEEQEENAFIKEQLRLTKEVVDQLPDGADKRAAQETLVLWENDIVFLSSKPEVKIQVINEMLSGKRNYKKRIQDIIENNEKLKGPEKGTASEKGQSDSSMAYLRNLANSVSTTIANLTGGKRQKIYRSYEEITRAAVAKFFERPELEEIIASSLRSDQGALRFAAFVGAVQQALGEYFLREDAFDYRDATIKEIENYDEELEKLVGMVDDFVKTVNGQNLLASAKHGALLDDMAKNYTISEKTKRTNRELENFASKGNILEKFGTKRVKEQALKRLRNVRITSENMMSTNSEFLTSMKKALYSALTGGSGTGTDTLTMAVIHVNLEDLIGDAAYQNYNADEMMDITEKMTRILKERMKIGETADVKAKKYTENLQKAKQKLSEMADIKDIFVTHESEKFYLSAEGHTQDGFSRFHGRKLSLGAMLEMVNSLSDTTGDLGISRSALTTLGLNVSSEAINGASNRDVLRKYFQAFAGIVMFDDFTTAIEAITERRSDMGQNIHLYRLNQILVPTSFFLTQTYNILTNIKQEIDTRNAFKVAITAPKFDYKVGVIPPEDNGYGKTMTERWNNVKATALKETKIEISFGAAFLSLIDTLGQL